MTSDLESSESEDQCGSSISKHPRLQVVNHLTAGSDNSGPVTTSSTTALGVSDASSQPVIYHPLPNFFGKLTIKYFLL